MKRKIIFALTALFTVSSIAPSLAWDVENSTDDFGSKVVVASTYFIPGVGTTDSWDDAYASGDYRRLIIRCQDRTLEVYALDGNDTFTDGTTMVRFGSGSAKKWSTSLSTDDSAIFFGSPKTLVQTLVKNTKFYIRANGSSGYNSMNFYVAGLSAYKTTFKKAGCSF